VASRKGYGAPIEDFSGRSGGVGHRLPTGRQAGRQLASGRWRLRSHLRGPDVLKARVIVEVIMDKLLLTPVEAAAALGIGRSKVYELMRSGDLPSVRIGACRRIPVEGLTRFLMTLLPVR
jgi:excisionase family DNA binding protein